MATTTPAAVFRTMLPEPRCTDSLKVTTMLAPMATAAASSAGLKVLTVGAVESTSTVLVVLAERLPAPSRV